MATKVSKTSDELKEIPSVFGVIQKNEWGICYYNKIKSKDSSGKPLKRQTVMDIYSEIAETLSKQESSSTQSVKEPSVKKPKPVKKRAKSSKPKKKSINSSFVGND